MFTVKTWDSISEKIDRVSLNIKKIEDFQDIVGLRIILLFQRDVKKVGDLIGSKFIVKKRYDTQERLEQNQFGYKSVHFVIQVPDEWLKVPTLESFTKMKAEIQIRTISQHIWAEASHKFQYKNEEDTPTRLLRNVYRISALLETVDLEFERILEERENYKSELKAIKKVEEIENELNVDLLEKLLNERFKYDRYHGHVSYSDLITELNDFNIKTPKELTELLDEVDEKVLQKEKVSLKRIEKRLAEKEELSEIEKIMKRDFDRGIVLNQAGFVRSALRLKFGKKYENYQERKVTKSRKK